MCCLYVCMDCYDGELRVAVGYSQKRLRGISYKGACAKGHRSLSPREGQSWGLSLARGRVLRKLRWLGSCAVRCGTRARLSREGLSGEGAGAVTRGSPASLFVRTG